MVSLKNSEWLENRLSSGIPLLYCGEYLDLCYSSWQKAKLFHYLPREEPGCQAGPRSGSKAILLVETAGWTNTSGSRKNDVRSEELTGTPFRVALGRTYCPEGMRHNIRRWVSDDLLMLALLSNWGNEIQLVSHIYNEYLSPWNDDEERFLFYLR